MGHLGVANSWRIEVSEPLGVAKAASAAVEELLRAVDTLWGTAVIPETIDWTFTDPALGAASNSDLLVRLEPFVPPHASLERQSVSGEVVVRSNWLPMRLAQPDSACPL